MKANFLHTCLVGKGKGEGYFFPTLVWLGKERVKANFFHTCLVGKGKGEG